MKTNQKQLQLIKYGLKPSTVTNLTESQVNLLFKKLLESKKEANEVIQVSKTDTNMINQLKTQKKPFEMYEDDTEIDVANASKGEFTQDKVQQPSPDGTDDKRGQLEEEIKRLVEKFESKKQQKYFFAKCGDGKTKEQKKWCKMADEFASKTKNFKKLPEKKKEETKESMDNYTKKVASAFAGGLKEKLNKININPTFGESEMEKQVLRLVEKHITPKMTKKEFLNLVKEQGTKTAPVKPDIDIDTPTKPSKPATPYKPKPGVKPAPKAGRESMPTWLTFDEIGINLK
jgi:hypothetical protein